MKPFSTATLILIAFSICCWADGTIFFDDFNTAASHQATLTPNATVQEYGDNCLQEGYLLTKWNYSWSYNPTGDWKQAFYCVPEGCYYMEQAGRSASSPSYRITAKTPVSDSVDRYYVDLAVFKADNDPLYFVFGADKNGQNGIEFGYENEFPGTDSTVPDAYVIGDLGTFINEDMAFGDVWVKHRIEVDRTTREIIWRINGYKIMAQKKLSSIPAGGYFGIYMEYERRTKFDNIKIGNSDTTTQTGLYFAGPGNQASFSSSRSNINSAFNILGRRAVKFGATSPSYSRNQRVRIRISR